jgi:hypothetical protein
VEVGARGAPGTAAVEIAAPDEVAALVEIAAPDEVAAAA